MNRAKFLLVGAFFVISTKSIADTFMLPFKEISWEEKTYKTNLPEPFGKVAVNMHLNMNKDIETMTVETQGLTIKVDPEHLAGVNDPGEPEITISITDFNSQSESKEFEVHFEYGLYQLRSTNAEHEYKLGFDEWFRKVMVITIDRNYSLSVEKIQ
jgi:hypothetical protein